MMDKTMPMPDLPEGFRWEIVRQLWRYSVGDHYVCLMGPRKLTWFERTILRKTEIITTLETEEFVVTDNEHDNAHAAIAAAVKIKSRVFPKFNGLSGYTMKGIAY